MNANNALLPPMKRPLIGFAMLIERKMIDKSAILRGFRAMYGIDQREAAKLAGLSLRTVTNAESGYCSAKAYQALVAAYAQAGLHLIVLPLPGIGLDFAAIIALDDDVNGLGLPIISKVKGQSHRERSANL